MENPSELRRDIVSGEWVVVATGRARRLSEFSKPKSNPLRQNKKTCPFEARLPNTILLNPDDSDNWQVQVVPNKYPAFSYHTETDKITCPGVKNSGPYEWMTGTGFHEVLITRDHEKNISGMSEEEVSLVIKSFQDRYLEIKKDPCIEYISIFQNHGREAGASISHPHLQIIAVPVVPPDVARSLLGSSMYFNQHKKCVHCVIIAHELESKVRVVHENEDFVVLTPFASRSAFEMRIFPKSHRSNFENTGDKERLSLAAVLRVAMAKLSGGLGDPDYNLFLHTAPTRDGDTDEHYHWHIEIIPKTAIWAGFELGTGIEISTIAPETAAEYLQEIKI